MSRENILSRKIIHDFHSFILGVLITYAYILWHTCVGKKALFLWIISKDFRLTVDKANRLTEELEIIGINIFNKEKYFSCLQVKYRP